MRKLVFVAALMASTSVAAQDYIGSLSTNQFAPDGVNNHFSKWNNCFYWDSPCNRFGPYGNRFSPYSGKNRFSPDGPRVYGGPFDDKPDNSAELQSQIDDLKHAQSMAEIDSMLEDYQRETDRLNDLTDQMQ